MSLELTKKILKILDEKKAQDIEVIDISKVSEIADYFIICSGTSSTHVKTLADEVEFKINKSHETGYHKEGMGPSGFCWIIGTLLSIFSMGNP